MPVSERAEWDGALGQNGSRAVVVLALASCLALAASLFVNARPWQIEILAGMVVSGVFLTGATGFLWPSLDTELHDVPMQRLIAFVGCDGSGKSTLTDDLGHALAASMPVRICYLGLGSGAIGQRIAALPLIGPAIERRLAAKAAQTRTRGQKIPGLATALVIYIFSLIRLHRFKRMLRLRRDGFVVLTDRYPQTEFPGTYDGPGLSAATAGSWPVRKLVGLERRIYAWMTTFHPDMIVRLNVDVATALARKPDHRADLIARKVAITACLSYSGAPIADLDATRAYADVRSDAARIIAGVMGKAR